MRETMQSICNTRNCQCCGEYAVSRGLSCSLYACSQVMGGFYYVLSFPRGTSSCSINSLGEYSFVLPYTILRFGPVPAAALVRFAHAWMLVSSSMLPPPTGKTMASEKPCRLCPNVASMPRPTLLCWFRDAGGMVPRALADRGSKYR